MPQSWWNLLPWRVKLRSSAFWSPFFFFWLVDLGPWGCEETQSARPATGPWQTLNWLDSTGLYIVLSNVTARDK